MKYRPFRLRPRIQSYSWGSHTAIAGLRGETAPTAEPEAEMWMGAHASAPSIVEVDGDSRPLTDVIAEDPERLLGPRVVEEFGESLPFLLKILAAEMPLSLQAHPSREQAKAGYERENRLGISIQSSERNYRDANAKPELVCALGPFDALYGFRARGESRQLLGAAGLDELVTMLEGSRVMPALVRLFTYLVRLEADDARRLTERAGAAAVRHRGDPAFDWLMALFTEFPGDPMCIAPLFLNVVHLEPGEALFTEAGVLHSYLSGTAVEIMANSDNVLRAGLTQKHVDSGELLKVLTFSEHDTRIRVATSREIDGGHLWTYASPAPEFLLERLDLAGTVSRSDDSVEILVCTGGQATVSHADSRPDADLSIGSGDCVFVPWAARPYTLSGRATLYAARVP